MGTSSDLAVRHRGQTYHQHSSYDGFTNSVFAEMLSTLAAAGIEALRARMDQEGPPPPIDGEWKDEIELDRRAMGNAYIQACHAREQEPYNLERAIGYEYGNPDYAHGGVIPLFAPKVNWDIGFCHKIEDATFILDLDQGRLLVPDWTQEMEDGSYNKGAMAVLWSVNLDDLEGLDPEAIELAFRNQDFDDEAGPDAREALISGILEKARTGLVERPSQQHLARPSYFAKDQEAEPSIHLLTGSTEQTIFFQALVDFLRDIGDQFPILAQANTLMISIPQDGLQQLVVDLRQNNNVEIETLVESLLDVVARDVGMQHEVKGSDFERSVAPGYSASSISVGGPENESWDTEAMPSDAKPLLTKTMRDERLENAIRDKEEDRILMEIDLAVVGFNEDRWSKIEASGIIAPLDAENVKQLELAHIASIMAQNFEKAVPGSTQARFERLSEGRRSVILEAMDSSDRYMFTRMLVKKEPKRGGMHP